MNDSIPVHAVIVDRVKNGYAERFGAERANSGHLTLQPIGDPECLRRNTWRWEAFDDKADGSVNVGSGYCCTYGSPAPELAFGFRVVYDAATRNVFPCPNCKGAFLKKSSREEVDSAVERLQWLAKR